MRNSIASLQSLPIVFIGLILSPNTVAESPSQEETWQEKICLNCQRIMSSLFEHYKTQTTRRSINHRIKHLCNRYFEYRRHCITNMLPKVTAISEDLERYAREANQTGYQTRSCCVKLGECARQS